MTNRDPRSEPASLKHLAGLIFWWEQGWCLFRADCGYEFDIPLSDSNSYVLIDPLTQERVGIYSPTHFVGLDIVPYRVFLLGVFSEDS